MTEKARILQEILDLWKSLTSLTRMMRRFQTRVARLETQVADLKAQVSYLERRDEQRRRNAQG